MPKIRARGIFFSGEKEAMVGVFGKYSSAVKAFSDKEGCSVSSGSQRPDRGEYREPGTSKRQRCIGYPSPYNIRWYISNSLRCVTRAGDKEIIRVFSLVQVDTGTSRSKESCHPEELRHFPSLERWIIKEQRSPGGRISASTRKVP